MQLFEIGALVKERRVALGLSQERLGSLAGLSRVTINQLENGNVQDLGINKLANLLHILGLQLEARLRPAKANGLSMATVTANVSYRDTLTPEVLAQALESGDLPKGYEPQISALLDEAPLPVVVKAVEEVAQGRHTPAKKIWQHLRSWSQILQSTRKVWV